MCVCEGGVSQSLDGGEKSIKKLFLSEPESERRFLGRMRACRVLAVYNNNREREGAEESARSTSSSWLPRQEPPLGVLRLPAGRIER